MPLRSDEPGRLYSLSGPHSGPEPRLTSPSRTPAPQRRELLTRAAAALCAAAGLLPGGRAWAQAPQGASAPAMPAPAGPPTGPARQARAPMGPTVADLGSDHYRFERIDFDSVDGARHYRLWLASPTQPAPPGGHPLLMMLDGNAALAALNEPLLAQLAASGSAPVIAALGYQTDQMLDSQARAYDYTPPVPGRQPTWDNEALQRLGGGADRFLDLIAQKLLPELRRRVPIDAARSTLWGHSYGGLCVLYALLTRPALFARYAAADPSLWWHEGFIHTVALQAAPLPARRPTELLLMTGAPATLAAPAAAQAPPSSTPVTPDSPVPPRMRGQRRAALSDAAPTLVRQLSQRRGLSVQWQPYAGVGHGAMREASLPATLALATRPGPGGQAGG